MLPIVLGTPTQFATLKAFLDDVGYTASAVSARAGVPSVYLFQQLRDGRKEGKELNDRLDLLIRLFMDVEMLEWRVVRTMVPPQVLDVVLALGLLTTSKSHPDLCHATVLLYPAGTPAESGSGYPELYVCSDLNSEPDPAFTTPLAPDVVYPAVTINTGVFLTFLPRKPCGQFVELCSGSGIAALLASRFSERAWAVDITDRSTQFAAFNVALNGLTNVVSVCGDLYDPVRDLRFDRIVAHPPYIPAPEQKLIFRDGGDDGERIIERVIAGLPAHLRPGGRFYCTCRATDRTGAPLEQRVRQMLGPSEGEFDVFVLLLNEDDPIEYYAGATQTDRMKLAEIQARLSMCRTLKVQRILYSTIVVQRRTETRPVFTERRQIGRMVHSGPVEWLMDYETAMRQAGSDDTLLDSRPRVSEDAELDIVHRRRNGGWEAVGCSASTDWPFSLGVRCPSWAVTLLQRCNGQDSVRMHLEFFRKTKVLGADPKTALLTGVRALVSAGVLEVSGHPLPKEPGESRI